MTRLQILERRATVARERAGLKDTFAELALAETPDETKLTELRTRDATLATADANLATAEAMAQASEDAERRMSGTTIAGTGEGIPAREVRAFSGAPVPVPQAFDGELLRAQSGERVPVLEARHRLAAFVPTSEARSSELGLGGFLKALYLGPQSDLERRVLAESSIGSGGALVPSPLAAEVIDLARAKSVAFRAGARVIPMTSQTLRFARVVSDPVGAWRLENAAIVESDPVFDQVSLTAKSWALIVRVSRELLEDGQNTDAQLRSVFSASAAGALDRAILIGSGTGPEPKGIIRQTGIQAIVPTAFSTDPNSAMLDAVLALEAANGGEVTAAIMSPAAARVMGGLRDSTGQPITAPARIAGIPKLVTTRLPATGADACVVLGDFGQVYVGVRTALTISVLQERYAENGQVGFVLWLRADVQLARPAALARVNAVT